MELTQAEEKIIQAYRMGGKVQINFFNDKNNDDNTKDHAQKQLESLGLAIEVAFDLDDNDFCLINDSTIERVEVTAYYQAQEGK